MFTSQNRAVTNVESGSQLCWYETVLCAYPLLSTKGPATDEVSDVCAHGAHKLHTRQGTPISLLRGASPALSFGVDRALSQQAAGTPTQIKPQRLNKAWGTSHTDPPISNTNAF